MTFRVIPILIICLSLFVVTSTNAAMIRCQGQLIGQGATEDQLFSACGEPKYKKKFKEQFTNYGDFGTTINFTEYERWIYQASPYSFRYEIILEGGIIKTITASKPSP